MTDSPGLTPSQTVGPYLSLGVAGSTGHLELVVDGDPRAIRIRGQLFDGSGDPVPDGLVEIWQANAAGRYAHPADERSEVPLEEGFRGFGRSRDGRRTAVRARHGQARPGPCAGRRHAGAARRRRRPRPRAAEAARDAALLPRRAGGERRRPGALRARRGRARDARSPRRGRGPGFDIHLQGDAQTTFFAV